MFCLQVCIDRDHDLQGSSIAVLDPCGEAAGSDGL